MNKEEKIEDMARVLCGRTNKCYECVMPLTPICGYKSYCEKLHNAGYRKIADDEIVIKKSEYDAEQEKTFLEWREEYDQNCLLRLRVSELEKELEKAKQETAREILKTVSKVYGNNHGLILWLKTTYDIEEDN